MVDEPQKGSPAAEAGIESGDIIRAVNGTKVKDARELARMVGMLAPKTEIKLDIIRQGQEKTVTVTLGEMAKERQAKADTEHVPALKRYGVGAAAGRKIFPRPFAAPAPSTSVNRGAVPAQT